MKKLAGILIMLTVLCVWLSGYAYELSYVSPSSDRAHLRAEPSGEARSLGLYFGGTPVDVYEPHDAEWLRVTIGAEAGYMHHTVVDPYYEMKSGEVQWRMARFRSAKDGDWVNLRSAPNMEASVLAKVYAGDEVVVMGETLTRWCYVWANGHAGYIMSSFLSVSDDVWTRSGESILPEGTPEKWYLSSGAGAWSIEMRLWPNGTFAGYYHDWNGGEGDTPHGTQYESLFAGRMGQAEKIHSWAYRMVVEWGSALGEARKENVKDGLMVITDPSFPPKGTAYILYLPGAPREQLPEEFLEWYEMSYGPFDSSCYSLYSPEDATAYCAGME